MKLSLITTLVSIMTIPSFAKYEIIYPVKDINFVTKTEKPVEPPVLPPVDPPVEKPKPEIVCNPTGATTNWMLFAVNINDNPNHGNRVYWQGQLIMDTPHMNNTRPKITSFTHNGYIYTLGTYLNRSSSGSSGIYYNNFTVCRQKVE